MSHLTVLGVRALVGCTNFITLQIYFKIYLSAFGMFKIDAT